MTMMFERGNRKEERDENEKIGKQEVTLRTVEKKPVEVKNSFAVLQSDGDDDDDEQNEEAENVDTEIVWTTVAGRKARPNRRQRLRRRQSLIGDWLSGCGCTQHGEQCGQQLLERD